MIAVSSRLLLSISLTIVAVGALDSFVSREWDLLVVFVLSALVQLVIWARSRAHRVPVALRGDLAEWLGHRAERTGESFDDMLDRSVAWYRDGLLGMSGTSRHTPGDP